MDDGASTLPDGIVFPSEPFLPPAIESNARDCVFSVCFMSGSAPLATQILAVGCGGFLGAVARFGITQLIRHWFPTVFPWGTFAVNMIGCFLIGGLMALFRFGWDSSDARWIFVSPAWLTENTRLLIVTGMLGSLTTFSTWGYETLELVRESETMLAALNVFGSLATGLIFVWMGHHVMHWLLR